MQKFSFFIGIDISKLTFHLSYKQGQSKVVYLQIENTLEAIGIFLKQVLVKQADATQILVCCEHTGTYSSKLALALKDTGITLWMVNPLVMRYSSADLNRYKTDKADSAKILTFAIAHQLKVRDFHHPSAPAHELKELGQARKQLVHLRQQLLNFLSNNADKAQAICLPTLLLKELKGYLSKAIKQIEQAMDELIDSHLTLKRMYAILVSIPGIGPVTGRHILEITDLFTRFTSYKAFACFVGTAPFPIKVALLKIPG